VNLFLRRLATVWMVAVVLTLSIFAVTAQAADDASVDHAEHGDGQLRLLVSVPGDASPDLESVKVTIDGKTVDATAAAAASDNQVRRTTILAIDTSLSMKGTRIAAAQAAALTYLGAVPANVDIGIVTFDNDVNVRLAPTDDRDAATAVINALTLKLNTKLYEGVKTAIAATGEEGQRQVLVLSDGQDNTKAPLQPVIDAIKASKVKVDVVSLDQGASAPTALAGMASASKGTVISADASALTAAFTSEADVLARQILVTAKVPSDQTATDATVSVSLDSDGQTHTASAFVTVMSPGDNLGDPFKVTPADKATFSITQPVLYGAIAALGIGVIGLIIALSAGSSKDKRISLDDQLRIYSGTEEGSRASMAKLKQQGQATTSLTDQARQAAETVLASNVGFEAKIAARLEGAGMALKTAEWLLLHLGIAFVVALAGLLFSGGNPIAMVVFLFFGLVGPWVYLGLKRSRRLKAFDSGLADTLQLMSGSLSAGLSLAQSMDTIVREGQEPITSEFKRVIVENRLGVGLEDALDGVAERMQSTDFKWVVMAIRIQREVGGNLAELLNTVAATLREREYLRRHVRALSAEGRLSSWILGGLPPVFLLYLSLTKPDYVNPMYTTPIGWAMCAGMAVLLTVGIFWMTKVSKVEV
jgi:tight adherence protein B